jgi:phytoene synthase
MVNKAQIFRKGSTTYFFSSIFFPPKIREKVFTIYGFVRVADNFVDSIPQQEDAFYSFVKETYAVFDGKKSQNTIIYDFVKLSQEVGIKQEWVEAFFKSMAGDLKKKNYNNFKELEEYIYGSAEVIGLFMAKVLKLEERSYSFAMLQGKAMQLINFIRDIQEDRLLGRVYMPQEDIKKFGISSQDELFTNEEKFSKLLKFEIERYFSIQKQAERGYKYIPYAYRIPIKTASDMYNWTAREIYKNPSIVFIKKVKPHPFRVILQFIKNSVIV